MIRVLSWQIIILGLVILGLSYSSANMNHDLLDQKYQPQSINATQKYEPIIRLIDPATGFFCTGFVVDKNYAFTAGHCIEDFFGLKSGEIIIQDINSEETGIVAQAAGINTRMDWGIVRGDFSNFMNMPIMENDLELTSAEVISCGFPQGRRQLFCSVIRLHGTDNFHLAGTGFLYPGMSGGPVLNEFGEAIAINSYVRGEIVAVAPLIGILAMFGIE